MTTDLGQRRADTTAVNQAVRALRAGVRPEQVVAHLATYCGLPLPPMKSLDYYHGLRHGWEITSQVHEDAHLEQIQAARERLERIRRRWPWSR